MSYPTFHRLDNRCLKRDSDTTAIEVKLPFPGDTLPLSHSKVTFPSKERLDQEVQIMKQVNQYFYEDFLATFFSTARNNEDEFRRVKQERMKRAYDVEIYGYTPTNK